MFMSYILEILWKGMSSTPEGPYSVRNCPGS